MTLARHNLFLSPPVFPIEVFEFVIDAVSLFEIDYDRRSTLSICALLCRTSRIRSQYWLFRDPHVYSNNPANRLVSSLRASPRLRNYVTELHVLSENAATVLWRLVGYLHRLEHVETHHKLIACLPIGHASLVLKLYKSVTSFHWSSVSSEPRSYQNHLRLISSLPSLSRLTITFNFNFDKVTHNGPVAVPSCLPKARISVLRLIFSYSHPGLNLFSDWFMKTHWANSVQRIWLKVTAQVQQVVKICNALLTACGPSLREMVIEIGRIYEDAHILYEELDLSRCSGLARVVFHLNYESCLPAALVALRKLPSKSSLQELEVYVEESYLPLSLSFWTEVDSALANSEFAAFTRVAVWIGIDTDGVDELPEPPDMAAALSRLSVKGVLHTDVSYYEVVAPELQEFVPW